MVILAEIVWLIVITIMEFSPTQAYLRCTRNKIYLQATPDAKMLVSSEYEVVGNETIFCLWEITAVNADDIVQFKIVHWFAPPRSDCIKDYLLLSDDAGMWTRPLQVWCKNSENPTNQVLQTRTATLAIELDSASVWQDRVVFAMEYWSAPKDIEVVNPVEFGIPNYILFAFTGILGLSFVVGCFLIVFKEYARSRAARMMTWKQKLMVRRKGISVANVRRKSSTESVVQSDMTSYIQLTETPTSVRYTSNSPWTPSPVTQISVSCAGTPSSAGDMSL